MNAMQCNAVKKFDIRTKQGCFKLHLYIFVEPLEVVARVTTFTLKKIMIFFPLSLGIASAIEIWTYDNPNCGGEAASLQSQPVRILFR